MSELDKMLAGRLYMASDPALVKARNKAHRLCHLYNNTFQGDKDESLRLLNDLLSASPENCHIEPDFKCDYGFNIELGKNFYANFDCIILDICRVVIGDNVMFGPRVCVYTAAHPLDALTRNAQLEFGIPVNIGPNVWVGGNTVILPGVCIGANSIIGAGSVVSKNIPADVLAVGNPCRVLREITPDDREHWQRLKAEYESSD